MREYLLVALIAASVTYLLSGLARRVALRFGALAMVRDRDVHSVPIPYFGGLAIFGGVSLAFLLAEHLPFLGHYAAVGHDARWVLLAGGVILLVGALDDLIELPAAAKFGGQCLAAGIVVLGGVRIYWIALPNSIISLDDSLSVALTLLFILICTNAINFIDGLDGLAAGVVAIGAGAFFVYAYVLAYEQELLRATTASLITVAVLGACLGFLPHNYHPAKMFMGDSGSMLLGLLIAVSGISFTGQFDTAVVDTSSGLIPAILPIILPIAIMLLPLVDLALAYIRRTIAGNWWFVADKQHLHHQLLERGHSHRGAVSLMYAWTGLISFGLVAFGILQDLRILWLVLVITIIIAALTWRPLIKSKKKNNK